MCKEDKTEEVQAIGWQAIDDALKNIYENQEPKHYGTVIPYSLGGNDPLQGISVYERKDPIPHWHFVTYGFSELYEKEWEDPEHSGYGFELTFRLKKGDSDTEPPNWALNFLQNIARYVFSTGNYFEAGHYLNANGPIAAGTDSLIGSITFIEDPELPAMDTQNGRVEFLQIVGITVDEEDVIKCWNSTEVLKVFSKYMPLYITDLNRDSLLNNEEIKALIEKGTEKDGSNTGTLFNDKLSWKESKGLLTGKRYEITIGAHQAETIGKVLKGRILKERELYLIGKNNNIIINYSKEPEVKINENNLELKISKETAIEIASELIPKEKSFTLNTMKKIKFKIEKTEIKDQKGNVVQVIG